MIAAVHRTIADRAEPILILQSFKSRLRWVNKDTADLRVAHIGSASAEPAPRVQRRWIRIGGSVLDCVSTEICAKRYEIDA